ncbi:MAG: Ppx/GppA family phosphatase [Actinobacteria bacterium]|nr:MAG: Ppx/GppA family phosphatase [Actinomycetota bacterium]
MGPVERLAVADLGSNSFRLVVYAYEPGRWWQHADEIREAVRISEGMGDDGELGPEPMRRALRTVEVFDAFCRATGIAAVEAVATSAIRDAANRDELLREIAARTSIPVRVLPTHEEARYGYLAIANSTTLVDGFGLDIGGGSVQAMKLEGRRLSADASWPLGSVRMSERFLPGDEAGGKALKALRRHVAEAVAAEAEWLGGAGGRIVGIGGTIRNLAAAAERHAGVDHPDAQGYLLARDALQELISELASLPASERGRVPGIKPDRGDVILGGAAVLAAIMDEGGFDVLEVTEAGLREGLFFEHFLAGTDPPLLDDVRRASVDNLANRYQSDLSHPRRVADLSLQVFDALAEAGLYEPDGSDRELLWAACMLHDIGTVIDYDDHHKHSRYLILNGGLPGFTPREVELIALVARYHRKGTPDIGEMGGLAKKGDDVRLSVLAGTVRLAEQLERSRDGSVRAVHVHAENGSVTVRPEASGEASTVAIWSARRNAELLESAIHRRLDIVEP